MLHSPEMGETAARLSALLFSRNYAELSAKELALLKQSINTFAVPSASLKESLVGVLAKNGAAESKTAGKKLIAQKAMHVNGTLVSSADFSLADSSPLGGRFFIVQSGKKHMHLIELVE